MIARPGQGEAEAGAGAGREAARISEEMRRANNDDPWYGSSRASLLAGVGAADAAAHPIPGAHSIWELVLHMTAWTREVRERLGRAAVSLEGDRDWPPVRDTSAAAWATALATLQSEHAALRSASGRLDDARLAETVPGKKTPAVGAGVSYYRMLHGLVQHDAYHSGQIALLKKALQRR